MAGSCDLAKLNANVMKSAGEIFRICQEWNKLSAEDQQDSASRMVEHFKELSDNFRMMLENDSQGARDSTKPIQELGKHLMEILDLVSTSEEPKNFSIDSVSESCLSLLSVLNDETRRKQGLDIIDKEVSNLSIDLDTSIMFLSVGILNDQEDVQPFSDHRDKLLTMSRSLVEGIKGLLSSLSSKEAMTESAEGCARTLQHIVQEVKAGSASLDPQLHDAKVSLLSSAKEVVNSFSELLSHARRLGSDQPELEELGSSAKTVVGNLTTLLRCVKTAEDTSGRSEAACEAAIEAIGREIANIHLEGKEQTRGEATPEHLVTATKAVTEAVADVVAASKEHQDQIVAAVNSGKKVVNEMLAICKAVAFAAENENAKEATIVEASTLGNQFQELLRQMLAVGRSQRGEAAQAELLASSKALGETAIRIAQLAEQLKGNDWLDPLEQAEVIAENEMMKAAESIEKAAKRLADIKKKKNEDSEQVSGEDLAFDDLILGSVESVTKAATSLINAATKAQRVLVAEGKMSGGAKKGREESQWSAVSAAQLVASVIGSLCEAANTVIQEGTDGNVLAATAKQVSKSTIQLVLACQVKADAASEIMVGLKEASNDVRKAADQLVKATKKPTIT